MATKNEFMMNIIPTQDIWATNTVEASIHTDLEMIEDVYYGDVDEYLIKHDKETNTDKRQKLAAFNNYIKGIVDSLLTPVFSKSALRSSNSILFEEFIVNCDNRGNDLQKFTKEVVKWTKMHGVTFVVMDNFSEVPDTIDEVIASRAFPYVYQVMADEVYGYETDDFGNLTCLLFENGEDEKGEDLYTYIDSEVKCEGYIRKGGYVVMETIVHNLGFLPIISLYDSISLDILPPAPFKDICLMNLQIYNQQSEQRVIERNSAFSMLTLDTGGDEHAINLNVGSSSILAYGHRDKSVNAPAWIAPDAAILTVMMECANNTINNLLQQAGLLGVNIIVNDTSTSGEHLAYKYIPTMYAIKDIASLAEEFEVMVSELFMQFIMTEFEYICKYNDSYLPTGLELTEKIATYQTILGLQLDETFNQKLKQNIMEDITNIYNIGE